MSEPARDDGNELSRHFGFRIGGPNVIQVQGRTYSYDIYDNVRRQAEEANRAQEPQKDNPSQ